jgi:predicted hydrocarbon binding protein
MLSERGWPVVHESLDKGLVLAGLDALREIGGDALVNVMLSQSGTEAFASADSLAQRVPIEDYVRYRNTAIDFLGDSFGHTAFQTGRILARRLRHENEAQMRALLTQFAHAKNKLPVVGQAAVLAAKGSPGTVKATMRTDVLLVITIENCPECRNLKRETPFCFLNQGLITEFAEGQLGMPVKTEETKCSALGSRTCEIEVTLAH